MKLHVKKNDKVVILSGKDKGKIGTVLSSLPKKGKVIVEKVNIIKKHTRPSQKNQKGGIIEKEAYIYASKVKLYNEKLKDVTRAVYKNIGDKRVRVCKKSGEELN